MSAADEDRQLAVHEAGHAVVGRALRLVCGHATIEADEDSAGHHLIAPPRVTQGYWEQRGRWLDQAVVMRARCIAFMAGREAEDEINGGTRGGDGDDRYQIALMIDTFADEAEAERWEARMRRHTRTMVRRHRGRIERVAAELVTRRTMTAEEIDMVCAFKRPGYPNRYEDSLGMFAEP